MELNLFACFSKTGYGIAALNIAKALYKLGVKVNGTEIVERSGWINSQEEADILREIMANGGLNFSYTSPCLKIWHQFALASKVGNGPYMAMPIFELDKFTEQEVYHLKYPDYIYANSHWAKQIIENHTKKDNVIVVPLGVDNSVFSSLLPKQRKTETYVFINIGKWEVRKGHGVLVEAFNKAFTQEDNVELWMCNYNPFYTKEENEEWANMYLSSKLGHKIKIISHQANHQDIARLINEANCGVFPSSAEGWNLELLECMSMGLQTIATNYSAHTEFCNKDNCKLIEIDELESAYDGKWFLNQGQWAKLGVKQEEQLIQHMRFCYKNPSHNLAGIITGKRFSWTNSAQKIIDHISTFI